MKLENIATFLNISITTVEDALQKLPSMDGITTVQQAKEAYMAAYTGSEVERLAMVKWLSLCTTLEQVQEAYDNAPSCSEAERLAMNRWAELSLAEITAAENPEQVKEAYIRAPEGSEIEGFAIRRLSEMSD